MKIWFCLFPLAAVLATTSPLSLHAQDAPPPPPGYSDGGGAPPPPDGGGDANDSGVSFQQFYDQLGSQGQWIQTDDYGYVFQPTVEDPQWAPYRDGHWVYSEQGWVWVSDEPWGWATYHYGRWANVDGTGWVWVPGYQWAPAWVSWRYGGGYAGWAPLPPATFVGVEFGGGGGGFGGFHFGGDVDVNFGIGAGCYNFVDVGFLGDNDYRGHYLDRSRNFVVINNTRNITNIVVNRGGAGAGFRGVNVGGPQINDVNAHAHNRIPTVALAAAGQPGRSTLSGNTLNVYAPRVNPSTLRQARPAQVAATVNHVQLNRGESVNKPLEVTRNVRPPAPSAEAIQAAQAAEAHAPANAHVATSRTPVRSTITRPLTQMEPSQPATRTAGHTAGENPAAATQRAPMENHTAPGASPYTGESHAATTSAETQAREREQDRADQQSATRTHEQEAATAKTQAASEERARTEATQQQRERTEATQAQEQRERSAATEPRERSTEESHTSAPRTEERPETQRAPVERAPAERAPAERAPAQRAPEQHAAAAHGPAGGDKGADKKQGQ